MRKALAICGLFFGSHVVAGSQAPVTLSFISLVPLKNWHVETDREHRLFATGNERDDVPLLIVEACQPDRNTNCPTQCDMPAIERSAVVSDLHLVFTPVGRRDGYLEYAASGQQDWHDGKVFTSIRIFCGPTDFVYVALVSDRSQRAAETELTAVVDSIKWTK